MRKNGKTMIFDSPPVITGHAGVAGKKEGEGPLANDFDVIFEDTTLGQQSFELAESALLHDAIIRSLSSAKRSPSETDFCFERRFARPMYGLRFCAEGFGNSVYRALRRMFNHGFVTCSLFYAD